MNLRGVLLVWIGLMGLAATAVSFVLLRRFPGAFSETGRSFVWPWQASPGRPARARGWLLAAAVLASTLVVLAGLVTLLS